jgi:ABC-type antimicrobial peptide transport system permease subunit
VSTRIPEIGIRIALGADRRRILAHVLARSIASAAIGVVAGLAGAIVFHRVMVNQLHGVSPLDPGVILGAAIVVSLAAVLSAFLPAISATRVDPAVALRQE